MTTRKTEIELLLEELSKTWKKETALVVSDWCEERSLIMFAKSLRETPSLHLKQTVRSLLSAVSLTFDQHRYYSLSSTCWQKGWLAESDMTEAELFLFIEHKWPDNRHGATKIARFHKRSVRDQNYRVIGFAKHYRPGDDMIFLGPKEEIAEPPILLHPSEWDGIFRSSHINQRMRERESYEAFMRSR